MADDEEDWLQGAPVGATHTVSDERSETAAMNGPAVFLLFLVGSRRPLEWSCCLSKKMKIICDDDSQ